MQAETMRRPARQSAMITGLLLALAGGGRVAVGQIIGAVAKSQPSPIITPGAHLRKLAGRFKFTEGPAADSRGNVYFTDQPNDRILKWSTGGRLSTFRQPCGRSNGLCFDARGN